MVVYCLLMGCVSMIMCCVVCVCSVNLCWVVLIVFNVFSVVCKCLIFMCRCMWCDLFGCWVWNVWVIRVFLGMFFGYVLVSVCINVNSIGCVVSEIIVLVCWMVSWYVFIMSVFDVKRVLIFLRCRMCFLLCEISCVVGVCSVRVVCLILVVSVGMLVWCVVRLVLVRVVCVVVVCKCWIVMFVMISV